MFAHTSSAKSQMSADLQEEKGFDLMVCVKVVLWVVGCGWWRWRLWAVAVAMAGESAVSRVKKSTSSKCQTESKSKVDSPSVIDTEDTSPYIHQQKNTYIQFSTMTDVIKPGIPLGDIQHKALEHDIRVAQTQKEIKHARRNSDIIDTYRAELLEKVHAHIDELEHLNQSRKRTSIFKDEMMVKVNEHLAEIEKEQHKKDEVALLKEELLTKVHAHTDELEKMDAKRADLSHYKAELLQKVEAHTKEMEHAHAKEAQVQKFSDEMKLKVREHEAHYADRLKMMDNLRDDITHSARSFYGGAYCVDESESF
eukprot:scaffold38879_cov65-Cyclotella_meneghiniana.AAC.5